jgi:hypothetical protein
VAVVAMATAGERSGVWDGPSCGVAVILLVFSHRRCPLTCPVLLVWDAMASDRQSRWPRNNLITATGAGDVEKQSQLEEEEAKSWRSIIV